MAFLMSADTSPLERPDTLALMATSRFKSRRLTWFGPMVLRTVASWPKRTMRGLPSAWVPTVNGTWSRSCGLLRACGARRTLMS